MLKKFKKNISLLIAISLSVLFLDGCENGIPFFSDSSSSTLDDISNGHIDAATSKSKKGSRDNTPKVLVPTPGNNKSSAKNSEIDYSNCGEGYFLVTYSGTNPKVKMQVTGPDSVTYTYDLKNKTESFPLSAGSGNYSINIYENISGNKYSLIHSYNFTANITNTFGPFLYPNQYVDFNSNSKVISKGKKLAYTASNDIQVVQKTYNWIIKNFSYDYPKARSAKTGYLPVVDKILASKKGICFDYASVIASMLRSQQIPTRLEIGYAGTEYHAWISVYITGKGWINGIIRFNGNSWEMLDPTFASTSKTPKKFTPNKANYKISYVY